MVPYANGIFNSKTPKCKQGGCLPKKLVGVLFQRTNCVLCIILVLVERCCECMFYCEALGYLLLGVTRLVAAVVGDQLVGRTDIAYKVFICAQQEFFFLYKGT